MAHLTFRDVLTAFAAAVEADDGEGLKDDLLLPDPLSGGSHYIETVWGRGYVLRDPAQ